eukprot:CAMPEP_0116879842 /NCGR_PEP_ID=MMETSP0463-20121206/11686_1 /TAXON_ID=181622 /ORGANISM="Strombidinopsis sp, Strain SopsisLIS2011" /LENGTH=59 /DNA_ID=CAMNT_0004529655 /DNA_START=374 /DNA_END=553 /DNA_ORIENTATION=+
MPNDKRPLRKKVLSPVDEEGTTPQDTSGLLTSGSLASVAPNNAQVNSEAIHRKNKELEK